MNDDYCDCPDGSDEPGTSACAGIEHAALAIRGYWCENKAGYSGMYLPLSRVNDGICDYELCCDGSDEFATGVVCEDRCKEVGEKVRALMGAQSRIRNEGGRKRRQLVREAAKLRGDVVVKVSALEAVVAGLEIKVQGLEEEVRDVEERERRKAVKLNLKGKAGKNNVLANVAQGRIDELRTALARVRGEEKNVRERLVEAEGILMALKESYNPNFNDEGVKAAVRHWEDYVAAGKAGGEGISEEEEKDLDEMVEGEGVDWEELIGQEEEDGLEDVRQRMFAVPLGWGGLTRGRVVYNLEAYLPDSLRRWAHAKLRDARQFLVENGILAELTEHDTGPESKGIPMSSTPPRVFLILTCVSSRSGHGSQIRPLSSNQRVNPHPQHPHKHQSRPHSRLRSQRHLPPPQGRLRIPEYR